MTPPIPASDQTQPRFKLGRLVATPGSLDALARAGQTPAEFLSRHVRGDWGDVCASDGRLNDEAIAHEGDLDQQSRVHSSYRTALNERIWLITEADRASTCALLPEEY